MEEVLNWGLMAANSSNLQPWEFYWVQNPEKKAALVKACLDQPAAKTAQELIVAVARFDTWKQTTKRNELKFWKKQKCRKRPRIIIRNWFPLFITKVP